MLKKSFLILLVGLMVIKIAVAQSNADAVIGKWVNPTGEAQILIYKKSTEYFGKIAWLKSPEDDRTGKVKTDIYNPNPTLHTRPILNLEILKNFKYVGDQVYNDGTIYDPKSGKTYSCKMTLNGNQLKIRGYIGISIIGRTEVWKRIQ